MKGYDDEEYEEETLHEVQINFKSMDKEAIVEFIKKEIGEDLKILYIKNNYIKLLYPLEPCLESAEIENIMYYALDDGKLGQYNYYRIDWKKCTSIPTCYQLVIMKKPKPSIGDGEWLRTLYISNK